MASLDFSFDDGPWQRAFDGGLERVRDLRTVLDEVGEIGEGIIRRNIEDGGGIIHWPPLAPATLARRARDPRGSGTKPLIWTRELLRSITHAIGPDYVDFGSPLDKALTLFFGSRDGKVPARSPFGLTDGDKGSIVGAFARHLFGSFRGRA